MKYLARKVLMVEPRDFHSNPETLRDNSFQQDSSDSSNLNTKASQEFYALKKLLETNGISVQSYSQTDEHSTPDAIFPNNWFSTHPDGTFVLYPMKAFNRRLEKRVELIKELQKNYPAQKDFSEYESHDHFLEGTGSLVLDHENHIAYAALSQRTHPEVLKEWSKQMNYQLITYHALDNAGQIVYHTNVVMTVGEGFAIVCTDSIRETEERSTVRQSLEKSRHEVIEISPVQMHNFCGNCLELENHSGKKILVMSTRAFEAFDNDQKARIEKYATIVHCDLSTIETHGGGGARCMIAELF